MNDLALARLGEHLASLGVRAALLSHPNTITWLTGYSGDIQTGPSPFQGVGSLAWWREGEVALIVDEWEAEGAEATGAAVRTYVGYSIDEPLAGAQNQGAALKALLAESGAPEGSLGVEIHSLPFSLHAVLETAYPGTGVLPLDEGLPVLRAIKSDREIDKLRAVLALCDQAQAGVRDRLAVGASELEIWGAMKADLEVAAGTRVPILADLVGGVRTADIGGPPLDYALQAGDPVIFDVVPRLEGYWGDNAATYFVGEPAEELSKAYTVVAEALRRGIEAVKPGLAAGELDGLLRAAISDAGYEVYPHHSGHGLGTSYHEEPRIVPYNDLKLEPGMVLALEPGVYLPDVGGLRLEHAVLVNRDGCEVLTRHLEL